MFAYYPACSTSLMTSLWWSPTSSPPAYGLCTLSSAFQRLSVPLSPEKTMGPSTSLEFLGIQLDSVLFQASLPPDKLDRIATALSEFVLQPRCSKLQLLSLLGHLNYAIRIIPQGRSFISHLLSIASSVPSLQHRLSLDDACISELRFWLFLLQHWNGISFFYEDAILVPEDLQLFTDAAPSIGFGGFYGGRWFASQWPPEFASLSFESGDSSALWELYPVVIAALLWGHERTRRVILIHSDNSAVVHMINKGRSKSLTLMPFLLRLTWHSIKHQFILRAIHIPGHSNAIADSLSRFQFQKFKALAPQAEPHPTPIPPFSDSILQLTSSSFSSSSKLKK